MVLICKRLEGLKISFKRAEQNDFMKKIYFFFDSFRFSFGFEVFHDDSCFKYGLARNEKTYPKTATDQD